MIRQQVCPEKKRLIRLMNKEMKIIANSPSSEVMQFRLGLLAKFAGELKVVNDRIHWQSCQARRGA
ncbi:MULTISPECIES: hypothetical protein [Sporosarcina]|uniref:Uncharacterized protein n=1 Tax=Sporosarcina newyorkensis TaxID=759851 RepID=A0A1T4YVC6_9BACL|nr:hypothetical protein [Sporosarcina newyorkensis]SKB05251.1 hypothetical protein SAMN04244570_3596 [Sporosarcina newyorkensis]